MAIMKIDASMLQKAFLSAAQCIESKKEYIKEIDVTLNEFTHVQSGATLAYLECDDTNKAVMAAFRTLPEDSTGVCHILEHSVLCGS